MKQRSKRREHEYHMKTNLKQFKKMFFLRQPYACITLFMRIFLVWKFGIFQMHLLQTSLDNGNPVKIPLPLLRHIR